MYIQLDSETNAFDDLFVFGALSPLLALEFIRFELFCRHGANAIRRLEDGVVDFQFFFLVCLALDPIQLELVGDLLSPPLETRIDGLDVDAGIASAASREATMPAPMSGGCIETGRLHLGSRGNRGIARSGGRDGGGNRGDFVIFGVIVKVASFFLLLGEASIARGGWAIFRHGVEEEQAILWKGD